MTRKSDADTTKLVLLRQAIGCGLAEAESGAFSHRTITEIFDAVGENEPARKDGGQRSRRRLDIDD
jgi:hypothetical protein